MYRVLISLIVVGGIFYDGECASTRSGAKVQVRPPPPTDIKFKQELDAGSNQIRQEPTCNLDPELIQEIRSYESVANQIINAATSGTFQGRTYDELAKFVDKHINRLTGSQELEDSIDYMMGKMVADGLVNVRGEPCQVPRWIRGEEKAVLVEPATKKIEILGLGPSVGTPASGISAEVLVVKSFEDLDAKKNLVRDKNGRIRVNFTVGFDFVGQLKIFLSFFF